MHIGCFTAGKPLSNELVNISLGGTTVAPQMSEKILDYSRKLV